MAQKKYIIRMVGIKSPEEVYIGPFATKIEAQKYKDFLERLSGLTEDNFVFVEEILPPMEQWEAE